MALHTIIHHTSPYIITIYYQTAYTAAISPQNTTHSTSSLGTIHHKISSPNTIDPYIIATQYQSPYKTIPSSSHSITHLSVQQHHTIPSAIQYTNTAIITHSPFTFQYIITALINISHHTVHHITPLIITITHHSPCNKQ